MSVTGDFNVVFARRGKMTDIELETGRGEIRRVDTDKIEKILRTSEKENCRQMLEDYFAEAGYDRLESLMIRLYITMDIYLAALTFTRELGVSEGEFIRRFGSIDDISDKLSTAKSTLEYFSDMLEQCVSWRAEFLHEQSNTIIIKAKEYIEKNYNSDTISLTDVADAINLSPTYFSAIFKKQTGTNFIDYLTEIRLEKAKELLCCTSMQISQIAFEVGFRDYRYFSQIFKKRTGMTPREFKAEKN